MKQATLILALLGAIVIAGCGDPNTTSQTTFNNGSGNQPYKPTTHLDHRTLVSNYYSGALQVIDAYYDKLTTYSFAVGSGPTYMQPSPDGTLTLVNNTASNTISSLDNTAERVKGTVQLGGWTESYVSSQDNTFGFAAVPNYSNGSFRIPGGIVRFNPTDGSLNTDIPFPGVQYLAMDTAELHLLAFTTSDSDAHWVDLTHLVSSPIVPGSQVPPYYTLSLTGNTVPLSAPIAAFFSADNTKAYILSCGTECGGTSPASVTEIDTTSIHTPTTPASGATIAATVIQQWTVKGARIGYIDTKANKLYVAGSTSILTDAGGYSVQDGYFTVIDLAAGTAASPIRIGNGVKRWIRNINGVFWVASLNCGVQSCVTMVNGGSATVLPNAYGDATGIAYQSNNGQVLTVEGGAVYIYNQKGEQFVSQYNMDVKGQGSDILYID